VDITTTKQIADLDAGNTPILVSESGIQQASDVQFVQQAGASAILVGEALMCSTDIPGMFAELRIKHSLPSREVYIIERKICGITTKEHAIVAAEHGATMIGFVFAPSTRKITIQQAKEITRLLPSSIEKVGVFVQPNLTYIHSVAQEVGLTMIQLHGEAANLATKSLNYPVIRSLSSDM